MMKKETQKVYIGPSLSGARLTHATVFRGEYPTHVKEITERYTWFKNLFVPVEQYAGSMKKLNTPGTALNIFAKKCKEV